MRLWSPARAVMVWLLLEFVGGLAISLAMNGGKPHEAGHKAGEMLAPIMLISAVVVYAVQRTRVDTARAKAAKEEELKQKAKVFE